MSANLDVDQLKTFIAICQTGSFTKAANQVNKTQSAVSMQMKRLEEVLGRTIFQKQGRNNTLTADGDRLLDFAHRMAKLNDEVISTFQQPDITGLIRFGTPEDYADKLLPEMLARFARSHPMVQVDVECISSSDLSKAIRDKTLDLAIVTSCDLNSVTFLNDIRAGHIIRREELVWVTSKNHCAHEQNIVPLALSHSACSWRNMAISAMESSGREHRIAYVSSNSNAVAAMVLSGMAIAAIPRFIMHKDMRVLSEAEGFKPLGEFNIGLLRADIPSNNAIDALACHISESFGNLHSNLIAAE